MIISIAGVGYAGAGAYFDLLCEYNDIAHTPNLFELGILYEPDGIIDLINKLKYNNNKFSSYVPISRFLKLAKFYNDHPWFKPYTGDFLYEESLRFVDALQPLYLSGYHIHEMANPTRVEKWKSFLNDYFSAINNRLGTHFHLNVDRNLIICLETENLDSLAKDYMCTIIDNIIKVKSDKIMIKHLCPPDIPHICFPYLPDNARHITVNRDPRDLYVLGKINNTRDFPISTVENFTRYYRTYMERQVCSDGIMYARFEDLCYEYESTKAKVKEFLNETTIPASRTHFIPEKSIKNTQIYKIHQEFAHDIKYIEDNLSDYLYPFEKYTNI